MAYNVIILPLAQKEIDFALCWYESKSIGLGVEFLIYLGSYFLTLQNGHSKFKIQKQFYRELPLKKFPYVIIYEAIENDILIHSVFNTNQNPKMKK